MPSIQPLLAWYFTFTLSSSFLCTKGFKSKSGNVWQKFCQYGYDDMSKMNKL